MRTIRIVLWAMVLVLGATVAGVYVGKTFLGSESIVASNGLGAAFSRSRYEQAGGPFTLLDTDGNTVTEANLRGTPVAMFFGFTHCPDVCPTAMIDAAGWLDKLGDDADGLRVVFVSVDPERDTPAILATYLGAFDDRIIGLTAAGPEPVRAMADAYRVQFEKVPLSNGGYTMNHTADILLFDREGRFVDFIPYLPMNMRASETVAAAEEERTMTKLRALVGSGPV